MKHVIFKCCGVEKHGWVCEQCQPRYIDADDSNWNRCCEVKDDIKQSHGREEL
jgi:hypothetical protein